jgi:hypothetical protein
MKQRLNQVHSDSCTRPAEALDRLIEFEKATDNLDDVMTWRDEKGDAAVVSVPKTEPRSP